MRALDKHTYAMCEGGAGQYKVVIGFATLQDAQNAHEAIARRAHDPAALSESGERMLFDSWQSASPKVPSTWEAWKARADLAEYTADA
jgi:hypothetical protein